MTPPHLREKAMQEGLKKAVLVPLKLAMTASALFAPLQELAQLGNINCKSDLQVCNSFLASTLSQPVFLVFAFLLFKEGNAFF